ncbi:hypothetical protein [Paenibacillus sp. Leaf72]|uniref:hypothetical protein n=1 Tax=Paenibacillus sp. Leaf72 TaxID=1736234 RepID=UPI0006F93811|nr:hypothetical protein [Paenibacillus sp. Leaf72]KQO17572.1 hypothetical protein ASF12_02500 [Paenibacillus sp. Leaf72]
MSQSQLDILLEGLEAGSLLTEQTFSELDADQYLDIRDANDDEWITASKRWELDADGSDVEESEQIHAGREQAFKQAFRLTGNHDLAGYISDDIRLICMALRQDGGEDPVIKHMLSSYLQGQLPLLS